MAKRDDLTARTPRRPFGRRPSARGRLAISLGVSALAHVALLAWVSVSVPENRHAAAGFERSGPTAEPPPERVIEVVRIQPPGVLPSGGSAGSAAGGAGQGAAPAASVPARIPPVSLPAASSPASGLLTFAAAPASPLALPALPALAVEPEKPATSAPNRGLIRRRPEAGPFPSLGGRSGTGSGRGFGGGGVTVTGIGTDCITAGGGRTGGGIRVGLPGSGRFGGGGGFRTGWYRR